MTDPTGGADRFAAPWRRPRPARAGRQRAEGAGPVASLWLGQGLSFIEIVALRSLKSQGHAVTLFTLGPVEHVPDGVAVADAREVSLPAFEVAGEGRRAYADQFRADLLAGTDMIWTDLDAVCVRPLTPVGGYLVGATRARTPVPETGVLRLPRGSAALDLMRAFLHDPNPIPWWYEDTRKTFLLRQKRRGRRHGVESLPPGLSGQPLLAQALRETGEPAPVMPHEVLYPVDREGCAALLEPGRHVTEFERSTTQSVHLFSATKRLLRTRHDGVPPRGSYLDVVCRRHDVDPADFPLESRGAPLTVPAASSPPDGMGEGQPRPS